MKSPCTKVCVMDARSGLCKGCLRTLDEIASWGSMSEPEHEAVFLLLEKRKTDKERGSDVVEAPVPPLA
jgi:predicted Fe-S protein YdhL (DUF1289 family)